MRRAGEVRRAWRGGATAERPRFVAILECKGLLKRATERKRGGCGQRHGALYGARGNLARVRAQQ